MTVVEHLTELRRRIVISLIAVALTAAIAYVFAPDIIKWLLEYYKDATDGDQTFFIFTGPLDAFLTRLKIATYGGILLAVPIWLWQLWRFITPGLYEREKRYAIPFVAASIFLFLLGAALALITFPKALDFFRAFGGNSLELLYTPGKYLGLLMLMMVVFGLGFEFPIVLVFLEVAGVLSWRQLRGWRRYAIVTIFVVDAIITPSGDPFTLMAMAIPMCIFYEISILIGRFAIRRA